MSAQKKLPEESPIPMDRFFNLFRDAGICNAETLQGAFRLEKADVATKQDAPKQENAPAFVSRQ